jgi:hypothetical protein
MWVSKLHKASRRAERMLRDFPASPRKLQLEWLSNLHVGARGWHSKASPVDGPATAPGVAVTFSVQYQCSFGQSICLLGSRDALGAWQLERAVPLAWGEGDLWTARVQLEAG